MRIFGIGIDIVEITRITDSIERFGDKFIDRIFTGEERTYCEKMRFSERHYAARFAAKEAISKSFGTGIGKDLNWTDMEILRMGTGEPFVLLHGDGKEFAAGNGITQVMVSLTHSDDYAAANAVAICD